ncbi:hypothetical protein H0H81_003667 [Sphagnurus paluster]|uniref:cutinase n=1 Tax=Sphagnurus paluster TaxID=117069 RepID=A0A9P7GLD3_9AGAR|nr:hypothetical protein H0H81_003667 [Sphagnurus paluster]
MANSVTAQATACPNTKIFISGYSQGAQVAHLAAGQLSADVQKRVNGAVVFGDPLNGTAFSGSIPSKTFCASGDNICEGGFQVRFAHFSYGANAGEAAKFVASLL